MTSDSADVSPMSSEVVAKLLFINGFFNRCIYIDFYYLRGGSEASIIKIK
jgi:hypothetical protein